MRRIYTSLIQEHLSQYDQMAFLSGARQVGKTMISKACVSDYNHEYLNWDNLSHRNKIMNILNDESYFSNKRLLSNLHDNVFLVLDEIHKLKNWKNSIKGLHDVHKDNGLKIILTGSAKLNIYRRGGDSMMGRYFNYTIHPLSVSEIKNVDLNKDIINYPQDIKEAYDVLFKFGGYPEAFLKQTDRFHKIWQKTRFKQLFREDIRDLEDIKNLGQLELLASLLQYQTGGMLVYSNLANKIQMSQNTVKHWINLLENFYFCFTIKPWSQNISRSIIKEPKIYLWDWSVIEDEGVRFENFVALHLLKAINFWNETGVGEYGLYYLRNKEQKEVDFLISKNNQPWILVESKLSNNNSISKNLLYFREKTKAPFAFQVVHNLDYIDRSCFETKKPMIVPARTFLSQLI
ncbi:MAG: AAA family ATPase [Rickettsiales bacterium]|nr:AAA family ATPase [Rickettsiales bacterium]